MLAPKTTVSSLKQRSKKHPKNLLSPLTEAPVQSQDAGDARMREISEDNAVLSWPGVFGVLAVISILLSSPLA